MGGILVGDSVKQCCRLRHIFTKTNNRYLQKSTGKNRLSSQTQNIIIIIAILKTQQFAISVQYIPNIIEQ